MDQGTLIVLTEAEFAPSLLSMLTNARPKAKIACAESLEDVQGHCRAKLNGLRLIAFCTDIIVPTSVLELCDAGAYNFHPGSPEYPGLFPSCFAIYEGAISFGATAHRMTQDIDAGEIVGTEIFEIPQDIDRFTLDSKSFEAIARLFSRLADQLADIGTPLPPSGEEWTGRARGKKDFSQLCHLPQDVDKIEFDRRYRAVGEGPLQALSIELFGHCFRSDNNRNKEPIFRGGQSSRS